MTSDSEFWMQLNAQNNNNNNFITNQTDNKGEKQTEMEKGNISRNLESWPRRGWSGEERKIRKKAILSQFFIYFFCSQVFISHLDKFDF